MGHQPIEISETAKDHTFTLSANGNEATDRCKFVDLRSGIFCQAYKANLVHRKAKTNFVPLATLTETINWAGYEGDAAVSFTAHADFVLGLVRKKDAAYGGAWQKQGYMGNLARIMSKTARLENIVWKDGSPEFGVDLEGGGFDPMAETVLDTLHDLMALCAFMASNIEEGNRWGK